MPLLPPTFLDTVVALGEGAGEKVEWIASGFFYVRLVARHEDEDRSDYKAFLVTNRHVVEGRKRLILRTNPMSGHTPHDYPLDLVRPDGSNYWTAHPNDDVDVAVIPVNLQKLIEDGMQVHAITSDRHVAESAEMRDSGVSEGDFVYLLGFPMALVGERRASVIVRNGCIARIQDLYAGSELSFLVDALVFPGNSGGPVILRPEVASISGTTATSRALLIGIVSGYLPYEEVAVSRQTGLPRVVFSENSGLVEVFPLECVTEAIDADPTWQSVGEGDKGEAGEDPREAVEELPSEDA